MKNIKFAEHILPHLIAVVIFLVVTIIFFNPVFFGNKAISQHDIQQWEASSKTLRDYRAATGEEGLWASAMFSGMPAYLVSTQWSNGPIVAIKEILAVGLPHPVINVYWAFLSFYILLLAFRIRPMLAIAGALAFGLSSYLIVGVAAGHNGRVGAIAFMPLVMAGIHLAFAKKRVLGFAVMAGGLALHLRENHMQMTYYLLLIVLAYGLVQLIFAIREKQLPDFARNLVVLVPAAVVAAATFFGQFWAITEYAKYSIRGPSELASNPKEADGGLSKNYAFAYSSGVWESMTLLIPNIYGGSSADFLVQDENSNTYKALVQSGDNNMANQLARYTSAYWGPQSLTSPYYAGAITCFLFVLGILFADRKWVWWLVPLTVLSLMLSWGSNFSSFNYFMFDYFPGYDKFRSVTFALIIALFAMPLLGMLGLERFLHQGLGKESKRKLLIAFGVVGGLCLLILLFAGMGNLLKEGENQLPVWFTNALQSDRRSLLRGDAFRSLAFITGVFILLFFDVQKRISSFGFYAFIIFMMAMDLSTVDKRYFTENNYERKRSSTFVATDADKEILKDKSYYRVYNLQESFSIDGRSSYFHYNIGGYHGAKLRRYQDLYDSCIAEETDELINDARGGTLEFDKYSVLDMLNVKYIAFGPDKDNIIVNPSANGNAWFVREVANMNSPAEVLSKVKNIDTKTTAVIDNSKFTVRNFQFDSTSTIKLIEMTPPHLKYESNSPVDGLAVFSEIYYPKGWHASIDDKEVPLLRADYILRALEIPAGKHTVEFSFEPKPYVIGNKVTMASSWLLVLLILGSLGWTVKKEVLS